MTSSKPSVAARFAARVPLTGWAVACVAVLGLMVLAGPGRQPHQPASPMALTPVVPGPAAISPLALRNMSSMVNTQDIWADQLRNPAFWASRRSGGGSWSPSASRYDSSPSGLGRYNPGFLPPLRGSTSVFPGNRGNATGGDEDQDGTGGGIYRTMCVRLCDGYFWPISYATTRGSFENDAAVCARSCGGPSEARLFSYRNPGGEIADMEDVDGKPYKRLQNAFVFRAKYEPSCKCRAHPWEEAATDLHKSYALTAQVQKGNVAAKGQLAELKAKMAIAAKAAAQDKLASRGGKGDAAAEQDAADESADNRPAKRSGVTQNGRTSEAAAKSNGAAARSRDAAAARANILADRERAQSQWDDEDASADERPRAGTKGRGVVVLRYGTRPAIEVPVDRPVRGRRAADAGENRRGAVQR